MNERIKKLAEQAYLYQEDDNFLTAALPPVKRFKLTERKLCLDY